MYVYKQVTPVNIWETSIESRLGTQFYSVTPAVTALADPTIPKVPVVETLDGLTVLWSPGSATLHPAPGNPGTRVRDPR